MLFLRQKLIAVALWNIRLDEDVLLAQILFLNQLFHISRKGVLPLQKAVSLLLQVFSGFKGVCVFQNVFQFFGGHIAHCRLSCQVPSSQSGSFACCPSLIGHPAPKRSEID